MKTGILFDLDGTLLNTLEDLTNSVNYALQQHGCPQRSPMEVRSYLGNGAKKLIASALPEGSDEALLTEVFATYLAYYGEHSQIKTRPYDGILEALAELRKEFPIAVVSNKPDSSTKPLCKKFFGEEIYALGEASDCPRKPAPDMLYRAMAAIGVDTCIYVGDSEVDVLTAKNAGVKCLSVLWGFRDKDMLAENGASYFCDDPKNLPQAIQQML